ncbi:hypothetical protein [Brevibacillus formosus]|uniref:hypothetical protein n=1 Tax=Brevibacillus formosus TaxID=54913 RepID=UPI003F1DF40D
MKMLSVVKSMSVVTALAVAVSTSWSPTASAAAIAPVTQFEKNNLPVIPSVHEMSSEQRKLFDSLVEEEVKRNGQDNPEQFRKALTDLFDSRTSGLNFNRLALQAQGIESKDIRVNWGIGVNFAASAINVALGLIAGGGVGAIQAYIISVGKKEAARIFTATVTSKLIAWGAPKLAVFVGTAVTFAMDYLDIGAKIAEYLDSRDSKPNNGWIDF